MVITRRGDLSDFLDSNWTETSLYHCWRFIFAKSVKSSKFRARGRGKLEWNTAEIARRPPLLSSETFNTATRFSQRNFAMRTNAPNTVVATNHTLETLYFFFPSFLNEESEREIGRSRGSKQLLNYRKNSSCYRC